MNGATVYAKTDRGLEELAHRTAALPQRVRSVLILVDGRTSTEDLLRKCAFIPQCAEHLAWLYAQGLIAPVAGSAPPTASSLRAPAPPAATSTTRTPNQPDVPEDLKASLIRLVHELLGVQGGGVVQRLADAGGGHDALVLAVDRCYKLIRLSIDEKKAEQFKRAATALLEAPPR